MNKEFWLDGFNFFHHWEGTKGLLRPDSGYDIVRAIERATRILGRHLGVKARSVTLYLDGGLSRSEGRLAGMRVRYCGPGGKADDRLADDLSDLGDNARMVTAVSNDRELKGRMRTLGAACLGVGEYLALVEGKAKNTGRDARKEKAKRGGGPARGEQADVMREKTRTLSESEVEAWLEYFGGDMEV
jgi:hypothetical protein